MQKPQGYDETKVMTDFEPLTPGGYVCIIKGVKEGKSRNNNDMLTVYVDIAEGPESLRFTKEYNDDTREDKKWPFSGTAYIMVLDKDGNTNRQLKTFIENVAESNVGWHVVWGNDFAKSFVGKSIGCVFGREEYQKNNGDYAWSTKCKGFRSVNTIREGRFKVPEDKEIVRNISPDITKPIDTWMDVDLSAENLPFN